MPGNQDFTSRTNKQRERTKHFILSLRTSTKLLVGGGLFLQGILGNKYLDIVRMYYILQLQMK